MSDATTPTPSEARQVALLPCPFCGGAALLTLEGVAGDGITEPFHARCLRCEIVMTRKAMDDVIAAWNRRALRQGGEAWIPVSERLPEHRAFVLAFGHDWRSALRPFNTTQEHPND